MIDVKIEQRGESNSAKYPYLGESEDKTIIVLFTGKDAGVVIKNTGVDSIYPIGYSSST